MEPTATHIAEIYFTYEGFMGAKDNDIGVIWIVQKILIIAKRRFCENIPSSRNDGHNVIETNTSIIFKRIHYGLEHGKEGDFVKLNFVEENEESIELGFNCLRVGKKWIDVIITIATKDKTTEICTKITLKS